MITLISDKPDDAYMRSLTLRCGKNPIPVNTGNKLNPIFVLHQNPIPRCAYE
jgi:hypothetical protein